MNDSRTTPIQLDDVPPELTVVRHIKAQTTFQSACDGMSSFPDPGLLCFRLPDELFQGLKAAAQEAIDRHGLYGWLTADGRNNEQDYRSLSLVCNPDLRDDGITDVHQSTLGTSKNRPDEFFYNAIQGHRTLKNTYFDSYGFRARTPASRIGALGEFLDSCGLTLIRSRLSVLFGEQNACEDFINGWHRDEPIFENIRVNIPLTSDDAYRLQIEHALEQPDPDSTSMSEHFMEPGYAYTFNTHIPHRVYAKYPSNTPRIHLVLGFAPWYSYRDDERAWIPNSHHGRTHPFDILRSGGLHSDLLPVA